MWNFQKYEVVDWEREGADVKHMAHPPCCQAASSMVAPQGAAGLRHPLPPLASLGLQLQGEVVLQTFHLSGKRCIFILHFAAGVQHKAGTFAVGPLFGQSDQVFC
jgi:hypothetical protein